MDCQLIRQESLSMKCDGVILSGGPDVNPQYYAKPENSSLCEIDNYRDSLEFAIIEQALKLNNLCLLFAVVCKFLMLQKVAR
jgi:gamma-glutamyl-gamma-aminobutyrate hydrolase PuuD